MSEKILNTRIINKNADLSTWNTSELVLKKGEIALAKFEATTTDPLNGQIKTTPAYAIKVGTGDKGSKFTDAAWLYAPASDVHEWAKKPGLAYADLPQQLTEELAALADKVGTDNVVTAIQNAINELDVAASNADDATNGGVVISSISQTDGKISVTRRALTAADIPNISIDQVDNLSTTLNNKVNTSAYNEAIGGINDRIDDNASAIAKLTQDIGNIANVMNFIGVSTTDPETHTEGEETIQGVVTIGGEVYSGVAGDVIIYREKEYVFDGTKWVKFGDASDSASAISALQATVASHTEQIQAQGDAIDFIEENYTRVKTTESGSYLVYGAEENVIIFDCGGAE